MNRVAMKTLMDWQRVRRVMLDRTYRACGKTLPGVYNRISARRYRSRLHRNLEIGCGAKRINGFETLNVIAGPTVDYVADASRRLPFKDETFDLVYASHVLEHVPWYQVRQTLQEWRRILKRGGRLEIWVPDGLKICRALADAEESGQDRTYLDGWYKFNAERDPCIWAASRLFAYGSGKGRLNHPNWHRALFTPRYLCQLFQGIGLTDIRELTHAEVRGYDHGWINYGVRGMRP